MGQVPCEARAETSNRAISRREGKTGVATCPHPRSPTHDLAKTPFAQRSPNTEGATMATTPAATSKSTTTTTTTIQTFEPEPSSSS